MIVSIPKRIIVLDVPRTGTHTRYEVFRQAGVSADVRNINHFTMNDVTKFAQMGDDHPMFRGKGVNAQNLSTYKVFAFYRDPFDRVISCVNHLRRGRLHARFFHAFWGNDVRIKCTSRLAYEDWTPEMKQLHDEIPLIEVFRKFRYFFEKGVFAKTHKPWLTDGVIPLNYHNFNTEMATLLAEFGVDSSTVTIPQLNGVTLDPQLDSLSPSEESEIRAYCQEDYTFLASKGITFS